MGTAGLLWFTSEWILTGGGREACRLEEDNDLCLCEFANGSAGLVWITCEWGVTGGRGRAVISEEEEEDLFLCEFADGCVARSGGASQYAEKGSVDVSIVATGASTA